MPFTKTNFQDGQVLYASHLNRIEDVLADLVDKEIAANSAVQSNWDETDKNNNAYIKDRPLWLSSGQISWDGTTGSLVPQAGYLCLEEKICRVSQLLNSKINFKFKGVTYSNLSISAYVKNQRAYENLMANPKNDILVVLVDLGAISSSVLAGNYVELQALFTTTGEIVTLGYYYTKVYLNMGTSGITDGGLYLIPSTWINTNGTTANTTNLPAESDDLFGVVTYLEYSVVTTDERYDEFFYGNEGDTSLHFIASDKLGSIDFSQYNTGDVVIVYLGSITDL